METPNYKEASELWSSFRDEVMFRQRFFLNHPVLDRLGDIARTLETLIAPGRIYYRARIIDDNAVKEHMLGKCYAPDRTEEERKWYHSKANKFKGLSKEGSYVPDAQLDMISHNLIGAWNGLFCDVPMVHLWLEMMLHQFGHSYHQNTENHRRYSYTAKTRKMCLDIFTFDKCRMLYDTLPLVEYLGSDVCDETRQMIERMAMDAIDKHSLRLIDELYFGSALIGIGDAPWSDYKVIPKRVEL